MAYGYYGNKRGRKQSRSKTKQLEVRRILASLAMAAGIFAYLMFLLTEVIHAYWVLYILTTVLLVGHSVGWVLTPISSPH